MVLAQEMTLEAYNPDPAPCVSCEGRVSDLSAVTLQILSKLKMESDVSLKHRILEFERAHFLAFNPMTEKGVIKCGSMSDEFQSLNTFGNILIPVPFEQLKDREITEVIMESEGVHLFVRKVFIDGHKALAIFKTRNGQLLDFGYFLPTEKGYEIFKTPEEKTPVQISATQTLTKDKEGNLERVQLSQGFSIDQKHQLAGLSGGQTIIGTKDNNYEINSFLKYRSDSGEHLRYGAQVDQKHKASSDELKMTADLKVLIDEYVSIYGQESLRGASSDPNLYGERSYGFNIEDGEVNMNLEAGQTYEDRPDGMFITEDTRTASLGLPNINFQASQNRSFDEEGVLETVENSQNAEITVGESVTLNGTNTRSRDHSMNSRSHSRTASVHYDGDRIDTSFEIGDSIQEMDGERTVSQDRNATITLDENYGFNYIQHKEIAPTSTSRNDSVVIKFKDPYERAWELSVARGIHSEEGKSWEGKIKLLDGNHAYSLEHYRTLPETRSKLTYTYKVEDYDADELGIFDGNITMWVETKKKLGTSDSGGGVSFELFAN